MLVVVHLLGGEILRIRRGSRRLVAIERRLNLGRERSSHDLRFARPKLHRRRRVADDERLESAWATNRVLGGKHAAPGLAQKEVLIRDAVRVEQIVELIQEEVDRPEVRPLVGQQCRSTSTNLVVVDDRSSRAGDLGETDEIVVRATWPTVRDNERRHLAIEIASDAKPRLVVTVWNETFYDVKIGHSSTIDDALVRKSRGVVTVAWTLL